MFDFSRDLFPLLMKEKRSMYGYVTDDYWCDIGDVDAYIQANLDVMDGRYGPAYPEGNSGRAFGQAGDGVEGSATIGPCILR